MAASDWTWYLHGGFGSESVPNAGSLTVGGEGGARHLGSSWRGPSPRS